MDGCLPLALIDPGIFTSSEPVPTSKHPGALLIFRIQADRTGHPVTVQCSDLLADPVVVDRDMIAASKFFLWGCSSVSSAHRINAESNLPKVRVGFPRGYASSLRHLSSAKFSR